MISLYKKAYAGLSKESWSLSFVMLINRSGTMVVPFMSIYCIQHLHFTYIQAGNILAIYGIGSLLGGYIGGQLTDKIGFYAIQLIALLLGGILFISLSYLQTFNSVAVGIFIMSICNESFRPANAAAVVYFSTAENKTRSYSLNRIAVNLGWAFGGALGGLIASYSYNLLFWVDGLTNIFAAFMLLWLLKRPEKMEKEVHNELKMKSASPFKDKPFIWFTLLSTLYGIGFVEIFTLQPVFYKIQWHFTELTIGLLMALNGLLIVLFEMLIIQHFENKRNSLIYISTGVFIASITFVLLALLPYQYWSAIIITIGITLSEMICFPFMNSYWVERSTSQNRGVYAGLYGMSYSASLIIGPALGGPIVEYGGFNMLWIVLALLCTVTSAGFYFIYKSSPSKTVVQSNQF
jgi:predicted MFS family arabinose efflux permease